ncbi:MAG: DMT family protein [Mucilaginibacter polytrichastri]|nr:DMT family protein [Mucilaginibacter polytrichastri]
MKGLYTIGLLIVSNSFMTIAWYGHLKFSEMSWSKNLGLLAIILISWGVAFFEYTFQVPANRLGFKGDGGPFSLLQLKIIQEAISISVFVLFALLVFKTERFAWNHVVGFGFILLAVYFFFLKKG